MGIPKEGVNKTTARMIFLRADWFAETGLPEPETLEDFLEIAKAMQSADPANRFAIPLLKKVIDDSMCDIIGMANIYGAYPRIWVEDGQGGVVYGSVQPEMIKVLETYAGLYQNGHIDPAFTSLDGGKVGEQLTGGKIGAAISATWLPGWPLNSLWDTDQADWNVYPLLPSSESGNAAVHPQAAEPKAQIVAVRAGYEHPEVLLKLLNFACAKIDDPERSESEIYHSDPNDSSPEKAFAMQSPFRVIWTDPMKNFNTQRAVTEAIEKEDTSYLITPHDKLCYEGVKRYVDQTAAGGTPLGGDWAGYKTWIGSNSTYGVLNQYLDNDAVFVDKLVGYRSETMIKLWSSLIDLEDQYVTEIISGARPVSDFEEFVAAWKSMGGEDITREVNEWYKNK